MELTSSQSAPPGYRQIRVIAKSVLLILFSSSTSCRSAPPHSRFLTTNTSLVMRTADFGVLAPTIHRALHETPFSFAQFTSGPPTTVALREPLGISPDCDPCSIQA